MANKLIAVIATDRNHKTLHRQAAESAEVYVRPLSYGDLSEAAMTVWADGKVHLTVKNKDGQIVGQYNYAPPAA